MRVLYDASTLGLGHLYSQSRGGSHRADRHIVAALAGHRACDLVLCANHSSVAFQGAAAWLAEQPSLARVALIGPERPAALSAVMSLIRAAHRGTRALLGSNVLPTVLRQGGVLVDRRVHPPVADADPSVDVFHSPGLPLPPRGGRRGPQRFLTIYDVSYLRYPDLYGPAYQRTGAEILTSLTADDWVIAPSAATRAELCDRRIASPDRIFVVPLAADPATFHRCDDPVGLGAVRTRYGIHDRHYILSVNSPDRRKNVPRALEAFARMVEQERIRDLAFVLAGNAGPGTDEIDRALAARPSLRDRVVFTGFVGDRDLAPLYSGATAFVYPSIYEGFGLPPVEAMRCGAPVVAARASAMPEVIGDAGLLVDPLDVDALASAMLDLYRNSALRATLRARALARVSMFTWERTVAGILSAYDAAVHGTRRPEAAGAL